MEYKGRDLKFTNVIVEGTAIMFLADTILGFNASFFDEGIHSAMFAEEMFFLKSRGLNILVKINSPGGDVFGGWVIADAVRDTEAKTQVVGLAASMSSTVLQFGSERIGNSFASALIHKPSGKDKAFVAMVTQQLSDVLAAKTNFTTDEIENMMSGEKDFVFTAAQMLEKGLIDRIEDITQPVPAEVAAVLAKLGNEICVDDICKTYNDLLNYSSETNNDEMKNLITALVAMFALKADASEDSLIEAATKLKKDFDAQGGKLTQAVSDLAAANEKVTALSASTEAAIKSKATALVDAAVEAGKISEDQKENFEKMAVDNYDLAKDVLDGLKADDSHVSIESAAGVIIKADGSKEDLKYEHYTAPENLKEWETMLEKQPERAAKIEAEYQAREKAAIEKS